mgnify:CR=1 FL=1
MKKITEELSDEEIQRNHEIFQARLALYRNHGLDQEMARASILRHIIPSPSRLLEIGTGRGHLTLMLAGLGFPIVSVDTSADSLRTARLNAAYYNRQDNISFLETDAASLPFEDMGFDVVISAYTFHHLEKPESVLTEMIRLAQDQILLADFNESGFDAVDRIHRLEGRTHTRGKAKLSLAEDLFRQAGFTVTIFEDSWQSICSARR